jgi:hypothetical protein
MKIVNKLAITALSLVAASGASAARADMVIEACAEASCSSTGQRPPRKKVEIYAATARHPFFTIWVGTFDKNTKKWSNVTLVGTNEFGEAVNTLVNASTNCGKTLTWYACDAQAVSDIGGLNCSKWDGKPHPSVSEGSSAKVRCN